MKSLTRISHKPATAAAPLRGKNIRYAGNPKFEIRNPNRQSSIVNRQSSTVNWHNRQSPIANCHIPQIVNRQPSIVNQTGVFCISTPEPVRHPDLSLYSNVISHISKHLQQIFPVCISHQQQDADGYSAHYGHGKQYAYDCHSVIRLKKMIN